MKMRNLVVAAVLLLTGSMAMDLMAQDAIAAVVKKCETQKDVQVQKVRSRDKDTKEVTREITNLTIVNNPSLVNELVAAFNKDKANALDESESMSNGKTTNLYCRFEKVSYSYTQNDEGNATISVIVGDNMRYFGAGKIAPGTVVRPKGRAEAPRVAE